ncbi:hypothetical protein [Amycolatopsis benzoatilytica]|uniref:hypothetical protein n=1 Tax=Amycolatopsis benzoatilytica TaxID=346045 RepID=UPI00036ACE20|nr:hypothetical protein [Amycolatopsis benzoatilytica]
MQSQVNEAVGEWLTGEFSGRLTAETVAAAVSSAQRDLDGRIIPDEDGELLYRLARTRLQRMLTAQPEPRGRPRRDG